LIRIELLSKENFRLESLDSFHRKQDVKKVYRRVDGTYKLIELPYIEDWRFDEKRAVAKEISSDKYITYLALENEKVVGFIGLLKKLNGLYMILEVISVDSEYRGQGIGRQLFHLGIQEAEKAGADALYISACSSEETIAFYQVMGCELAKRPIKEMAEAEPCDLQMVCNIKVRKAEISIR